MPIPFAKYSGCGNDFILIDNRKIGLTFSTGEISKLCHRRQGIGADGVILLETARSKNIPYRMRIFNADGSEAEMCGNGVRCLAQFIRETDLLDQPISIETMQDKVSVSFSDSNVTVLMPSPRDIALKSLVIHDRKLQLHCLNTGVPHAVLFLDPECLKDSLFDIAPAIRFHPCFPKGTNVNFAALLPDFSIAVRTYERGVEQETQACGTGAVAVAISAASHYNLPSPLTIHTRSGDSLLVNFQKHSESQFQNIRLTGPAIKTFEGSLP